MQIVISDPKNRASSLALNQHALKLLEWSYKQVMASDIVLPQKYAEVKTVPVEMQTKCLRLYLDICVLLAAARKLELFSQSQNGHTIFIPSSLGTFYCDPGVIIWAFGQRWPKYEFVYDGEYLIYALKTVEFYTAHKSLTGEATASDHTYRARNNTFADCLRMINASKYANIAPLTHDRVEALVEECFGVKKSWRNGFTL